MQQQQQQQQYGPKIFTLSTPGLAVNISKKIQAAEETLSVNDAPRAGQAWYISSVFFSFPNATKNLVPTFAGEKCEYIFTIEFYIGSVKVAEQQILETQEKEESTPLHIVGSLEPFIPATAYAGQDVRIIYRISTSLAKGAITTSTGTVIINYLLKIGV
jgi:hypothetical protein